MDRRCRPSILGLAGFAVLATLGFETVPLPLRAQIVPLASCIAALALPLVVVTARRPRWTPVAKTVAAFVLFAAVHSLVALAVDFSAHGVSHVRLVAWLRQLGALGAGAAAFMVLREAMRRLSDRAVVVAVSLGGLPGVLLGVLTVLWGGLGVAPAGWVVRTARAAMLPPGLWVPSYFSDPRRAAGFCFEPSHFAILLATTLIPATLVWLVIDRDAPAAPVVVLALEGAAFAWTFSGVGVAVVAGMFAALVARGHLRRSALAAAAAAAVAVVLSVLLVPDNYIAYQGHKVISSLEAGDLQSLPVSVTIPLFATLGPFARAFSSLNLLGYGLGGASTHIAEIMPRIAVHDIEAGSWSGMPDLATAVGRVFAETGLVGLVLFVGLWVVAFRALRRSRSLRPIRPPSPAAGLAAGTALVGLAIAYTIKIGSFALPFLWFWLAYVDARSDVQPPPGGGGPADASGRDPL